MSRHYDYLIVGGGMTAAAAVRGIRESDSRGSIGVLSAESDPPYDRPPLSKGLWKDKPLDSIWREHSKERIDLRRGCRVESLDLWRRQVTDARKASFTFTKLLLATGGRPRQLPFGGKEIIYYRTVQDYLRLRALMDTGRRFMVLGGGFIGAELSAALALNHKEVILLFPDQGIGGRMFPRELSLFLNQYYREHGVEVHAGTRVKSLQKRGDQFLVNTQSEQEFLVDGVVAGLGLEPNLELAQAAGLRVESGIVVDEFLRTSHPDIYAAGDVAAFYSPALRRRLRVEHEDNANCMGWQAGRNMAGKPKRYLHLPFFYSDLFELGYEAVGETDSRLTTSVDWKEPLREGVVYYHRDGRLRGVLLWNIWGKLEAARQLIASNRHFRPEELNKELLAAA